MEPSTNPCLLLADKVMIIDLFHDEKAILEKHLKPKQSLDYPKIQGNMDLIDQQNWMNVGNFQIQT